MYINEYSLPGFLRIICIAAIISLMTISVSRAQEHQTQDVIQPIPDTTFIQPEELAELLRSEKNTQLLILQVGVQSLYDRGHIPGSEYTGSASDSIGMKKLRKRVKELPRDKFIVIYCGCCPLKDCPNIKPAYRELKSLGFNNTKMLYLPDNFNIDWIAKNYPVSEK
ncbi:MAG TPA: rhodanese-like domain-containing protein [Ignavibacteriaceae bacterium]|nr:rhodanese-like domain-containing protein [Ignavibacteriaceae bacterium]